MADEVRVNMQLSVVKNNLQYRSVPGSFTTDLVGTEKGPLPGAVTVPTAGILIYLRGSGAQQLARPGWCRMHNIDQTNYVEWGIFDVQGNKFFTLGELGPDEQCLFKFSRNFQEEYTGSGTGTTGPENYLRLKANVGSVTVIIDAFEA